ncbi:MAG: DUF3899 domain-containing protein [Bacilli bacterium]|nr:DUF3899 domain-containing protein [Bacilli bacterium]
MGHKAKKFLLHLSITLGIALTAFLSVLFLRQDFKTRGFCDAFFVSSVIPLGYILMRFAIRAGTFDILNYGMYRLIESFRKGNMKRYQTAYDYKQARDEDRAKNKLCYWPYVIVGVSLLIAGLICYLLYVNGI